MLKSFSEAF
jgi:hypothetical protein